MHFVATFASVGLFRLILCGYVNSLANSEHQNWTGTGLAQGWSGAVPGLCLDCSVQRPLPELQQLLSVSDFLCTLAVLISIILLVSLHSWRAAEAAEGGVGTEGQQSSRDALLKSSVNKYANVFGVVRCWAQNAISFA